MAEPTTPNTGFIVPNTGDLVGTWGSAAVNPDFVALDGMLAGTQTIGLTSGGSLTLTTPSATIVPSQGPNQSQNACVILTGTLTNNTVITLTLPGRYVFHNQCLPWVWYVQLQSIGGGTKIGLPPGKKTMVYHDGTNVDFLNPPDTGTAYDLHGVVALPAWMQACSTLPYLIKDGSVYNISAYPYLGGLLGSTFGGNGISTFAVPDERARARIGFDTGATGRLTFPGNGTVSGVVMGSAGGAQNETISQSTLPNYALPVGVTNGDIFGNWSNVGPGSSQSFLLGPPTFPNGDLTTLANLKSNVTVTVNLNGSGNPLPTVQPSIVSFLPLIKT